MGTISYLSLSTNSEYILRVIVEQKLIFTQSRVMKESCVICTPNKFVNRFRVNIKEKNQLLNVRLLLNL